MSVQNRLDDPSAMRGVPSPRPEREPVTSPEELALLDSAEIVEGYLDGFNGDAEPGDNRSKSYWHGWRNGAGDRNRTVDAAQRKLAHALHGKAPR